MFCCNVVVDVLTVLKNNVFVLLSSEMLKQLIKKCWSHNITTRPTFEQVKKMLDKMNPHKVSPVDMMMNLVIKPLKSGKIMQNNMKSAQNEAINTPMSRF